MTLTTKCPDCSGYICKTCGGHFPCGCDAVGMPIPADLQCYGVCSKYQDTPHTHVRGRENRPGYSPISCGAPSTCDGHGWDIHHAFHFHKEVAGD